MRPTPLYRRIDMPLEGRRGTDPLAGTLQYGFIVEVKPRAATYKLRIPGVPNTVDGIPSDKSTMAPGGAHPVGMFGSGTRVLVYIPVDWSRRSPVAVLWAVPILTDLNISSVWDLRAPPTRFSIWPPRMEYYWYDIVPAASSGTPEKEGTERFTTPEAQGTMYPTGVQVWSNLFQAVMLAGEKAGIEASIVNNMLKVIGFNMVKMTGGSLERSLSDRGEYTEFYMSTPYLDEAKRGSLQPTRVDGDLLPHHVRLRGYQGDVEREIVQIMPGTAVGTMANPSSGASVLEIHKAHDGAYSLRSAKDIEFRKTNPLGPIRRKGLLENVIPAFPAGRTFAGITGMGDYLYTGDSNPAGPGYAENPGTARDLNLETDFSYTLDGVPDPAKLPTGNYWGLVSLNESDYRYTQRLLPITDSALFEFGSDPSVTNDGDVRVTGSDHRDTLQYQTILNRLASIFKMNDDGSMTLQFGPSKINIGAGGIELYGDQITLVGKHGVAGIAERVAFTSELDMQVSSGNMMVLHSCKDDGWGGSYGSVVVEGLLEGHFQSTRKDPWTTVDIRLLGNDGTGWTVLETIVSGTTNDGHYEGTISDTYSDYDLKVQVGKTTDGVWEYLEYGLLRRGTGGAPPLMVIAKADMSANDTPYTCNYIDASGNEDGGSINLKRPYGIYISQGDIGFIGTDIDGNYIFMPANMREEGEMPLVVENRTDDPVSPAQGKIWIRTDL
jgi:hypothetical protein